MLDYIAKLEKIADVHINHSPTHKVDSTVLEFDRAKFMPYVKGTKILEMGFGDGDWTKQIIEKFGETHILDASTKLLAQAKQIHKDRVTTYAELFENFTPPQGLKFDTIVATHVLEHVDDPVLVLKKMREWLAPNGRVIVIVPNAGSIHRRLAVKLGIQKTLYDFSPRDLDVGHQRVYDLDTLRKHVSEAKYKIAHERGFFLKVLPNAMMLDYSKELLQALVDISDELPAEWMANLGMIIEAA